MPLQSSDVRFVQKHSASSPQKSTNLTPNSFKLSISLVLNLHFFLTGVWYERDSIPVCFSAEFIYLEVMSQSRVLQSAD